MKPLLPQAAPLISYDKLVMELVGTFALTYVGCMSIVYSDVNSMTLNGVGLSSALVLIVFMWFGLDISGAHYNPAITIALIIVKQVNWYTGLMYVGSQFAGALMGAGTVYVQLSHAIMERVKDKSMMGIPRTTAPPNETGAIWGELLGTYAIMFVYMATCTMHNSKRVAGVGGAAVGFSVFVATMTVGELSGGGFNPARSLAPAILLGKIEKDQFTHFFGPIIGAALASMFYKYMFVEDEDDAKDDEHERQLRELGAASLNRLNDTSGVY